MAKVVIVQREYHGMWHRDWVLLNNISIRWASEEMEVETHGTGDGIAARRSVASAAERASWMVGSTIPTVAALWCAEVDTRALDIRPFTGRDRYGRH